jgi:hypothetical protein
MDRATRRKAGTLGAPPGTERGDPQKKPMADGLPESMGAQAKNRRALQIGTGKHGQPQGRQNV